MNNEADQTKQRMDAFASQIVGMPCWAIGAGVNTGASFSLSLGGKRQRPQPAQTPRLATSHLKESGEADLMVWCTWRLDERQGPVASSDQDIEVIVPALDRLTEQRITAVHVREPAWDLTIEFSNGLRLIVFCDHVPPNPSLDGNWELAVREEVLIVGAGSAVEFTPRTVV